jgi:hypothetical protein
VEAFNIQSVHSTSTGGYVLWLTYNGINQVTPGLYFSTSAGTITADISIFAQYNAQQTYGVATINNIAFSQSGAVVNPQLSTINISFTGHGEGSVGNAISTSGQLEIS